VQEHINYTFIAKLYVTKTTKLQKLKFWIPRNRR